MVNDDDLKEAIENAQKMLKEAAVRMKGKGKEKEKVKVRAKTKSK